jgi:hypothetical protein
LKSGVDHGVTPLFTLWHLHFGLLGTNTNNSPCSWEKQCTSALTLLETWGRFESAESRPSFSYDVKPRHNDPLRLGPSFCVFQPGAEYADMYCTTEYGMRDNIRRWTYVPGLIACCSIWHRTLDKPPSDGVGAKCMSTTMLGLFVGGLRGLWNLLLHGANRAVMRSAILDSV